MIKWSKIILEVKGESGAGAKPAPGFPLPLSYVLDGPDV